MIELPLLAVDVEGVISIIVFLLFIIMSIVGKVFNQAAEKQKAQRRPRPAPRPQGQAGDEPVAAEIKEFLQRVGRGEAGQKAKPTVRHEHPVSAEVVEPRGLLSASQPLQPHHGSEELKDHLEPHLAQEVALADDQMDARVHDTFDHRLGSLGAQVRSEAATEASLSQEAVPAAAAMPTTAAAGLAAMLADPVSLRQAVVLSEILQRPEHRWS